jgi:hypothetical protein
VVPLNRLDQRPRLDVVEFRKMSAQHDLVAADEVDAAFDDFDGNKLALVGGLLLGHGRVGSWASVHSSAETDAFMLTD